jgi:hypothetical protein
MNAEMTNKMAIARVESKIRYLKSRLSDPATPERTAHFVSLDLTAFEMAVAALQYLHEFAEYEAAQKN